MKNWKKLFSKRNLDRTLSQGQGAQLFWLLGALAAVVAVLLLVGYVLIFICMPLFLRLVFRWNHIGAVRNEESEVKTVK